MTLSKAQKEVVSALKEGSFVWTNEGANFKAWIGDSKGNKQKGIKVSTASILVEKKVIQCVDGEYRQGLFKYELIKKG